MLKQSSKSSAVWETSLPLKLANRGKVRDIYGVGPDKLLIVTTDRLSAFDVVLPTPIPEKGAELTQMSRFWLNTLPACAPHHLEYVVSPGHAPGGSMTTASRRSNPAARATSPCSRLEPGSRT